MKLKTTSVYSTLPTLIAAILLLAAASAGAGGSGAAGGLSNSRPASFSDPTPAPGGAGGSRGGGLVNFIEQPGEKEFSGQMIARPYQIDHWRDLGMSDAAAMSRIQQAHDAIAAGYLVQEYVWQTDEYIFAVPEAETENSVANSLLATGNFQYIHPNWIVYPVQNCPNDPLFSQQWHHAQIESCLGWDIWTGDPTVTVGVCDSGIRVTHQDLQMNRLEGYNAVAQLWESQGGDISEIFPHGTGVTGSAAANSNNGIGVAGVGWNYSHRMLRVTNDPVDGLSTVAVLTHAARTAVESGDRVANVSYGGVGDPTVRTTATYIKSIGGLLIWAAGNNSQNLNWGHHDNDDVIVVGATDGNDNLAGFSNFGTSVDLVAPGVGVFTTGPSDDFHYAAFNGTSFATPLVSGLAALIWSYDPSLTPDEVEFVLKQTCDLLGNPNQTGHGRINVRRAMQMLAPGTILVPAHFPTIQQAINASWHGDEIIVSPGTYPEHIDFLGRRIHLRSAAGPASTIIDGQGVFGSVVTCAGGETQNTILEGFTVTGGNAGPGGGGMMISGLSSPTVINCTFVNNSAVGYGGGVRLSTSLSTESTFTNCRFIENSAESGGGMHKGGSGVVHLIGCEFEANTANDYGGGLYFSGGAASYTTATDCTFIDNDAGSAGGGVFNTGASNTDSVFINCLFEANTAGPGGGGGLYNNTTGSSTQLIGCAFIDNSAGGGGAIVNFHSSPDITGCEFRNNAATTSGGGAIYTFGSGAPSIGTSLFCENTPDDFVGPWNDQGGNQFSPNCPGSGNTIHVPADYPTIQAAIDAAQDGDEIIVAPGTYYETLSLFSKTILLHSSGGPMTTVIDGQGSGSVMVCGQGTSATIEGFTFANGANNGGGMYILQSSPTVIDCIFRDNNATGNGGGVYAQQSSSSFINCTFENNTSAYWGGGMMISNLGADNPTLIGCTFRRNISGTDGGGLVINNSSATVSNCTFITNLANTHGGGLYNMNGATPEVTNSTFERNIALASGGGMYNHNSSPLILDCSFKRNFAPVSGGGVGNSGGNASIGDSLFCQNQVDNINGSYADLGGNVFIVFHITGATVNCP